MAKADFTTVSDNCRATIWYRLIPFFIALIYMLAFFSLEPIEELIANFGYVQVWIFLDEFTISIIGIFFLRYTALQLFRVVHEVNEVAAFENALDPVKYRLTMMSGAPGSGKSSTIGYKAVVAAEIMWNRLKLKYWLVIGKRDAILARGNDEEIEDMREIIESYEFWMSYPDAVPCLMSNTAIGVDGRMSMKLSYKHLIQESRMPGYCVIALQEAGGILTVEDSKDKVYELSDLLKFERHFGEWVFYLDEQDKSNAYIDLRRVISCNEYLFKQEHVGKPKLLNSLTDWLISILLANIDKNTEGRWPDIVKQLITLNMSIGFRKYTYSPAKNENGAMEGNRNNKNIYYLPCLLNHTYNDRAFRNLYKAKDFNFDITIWDRYCMDEEDNDFQRKYIKQAEAKERKSKKAKAASNVAKKK